MNNANRCFSIFSVFLFLMVAPLSSGAAISASKEGGLNHLLSFYHPHHTKISADVRCDFQLVNATGLNVGLGELQEGNSVLFRPGFFDTGVAFLVSLHPNGLISSNGGTPLGKSYLVAITQIDTATLDGRPRQRPLKTSGATTAAAQINIIEENEGFVVGTTIVDPLTGEVQQQRQVVPQPAEASPSESVAFAVPIHYLVHRGFFKRDPVDITFRLALTLTRGAAPRVSGSFEEP